MLQDDKERRARGGENPTRIQSVARAMRLLVSVAEQRQGATAKELAAAEGLALPTTYHLLNTLAEQGMLHKGANGDYDLGRSVAIIAQAYLGARRVSDELLGALRTIASRTKETAYLAEWREHGIRVVASVEGSHPVRVTEILSGPYEHGHARANGKVLLAYAPPERRSAYLGSRPLVGLTAATISDRDQLEQQLEQIRERGFAYDEEEYSVGVSCVAAPLFEGESIVAALGVSVPSERFERRRAEITAALLEVAGRRLSVHDS